MMLHRSIAVALAVFLSPALVNSARADANAFGISYDSKPLPEGVTRVASWREFDAVLSPKNLAARYFTPDASFVKVYFDSVQLPAGWELVVQSVDASEQYRYGGENQADRTVDVEMGQTGELSFSAMSVEGSEVEVFLEYTGKSGSNSARPAAPSVHISHVLEGYPEGLMAPLQKAGLLTDGSTGPGIESICGTDNKRAVACYTGTQATRANAVARLLIGGGGSCTTWRVGSGNRFMTNNHCFATSSVVAASEVQFNYQNTTCTGTTGATVTKVAGSSLLKTSASLDYSLYTVTSTVSLGGFGGLSLDVRVPTSGEQIYIPQHPGGRKKELAITSTSDSGSVCRIGTASSGVNSLYLCDTEGGSSGSPVLANSSHKVINLHHLGGCSNAGVRISRIWPEISSFFSAVP